MKFLLGTNRVVVEQALTDIIGNLSTLPLANKTTVVDCINSILTKIQESGGLSIQDLNLLIGLLTDLTTVNKTSVVAAINEINNNIKSVVLKIGSLDSLITSDKTNITNAINEVNREIISQKAEIMTVATPNKILKLDSNSKLPTSITGDSATVGGRTPASVNGIATLDENGKIPKIQMPSLGTWEKIADVTLTSDVSQIDFQNLNLENYKYLKIIGEVMSARTDIDTNRPMDIMLNDLLISTISALKGKYLGRRHGKIEILIPIENTKINTTDAWASIKVTYATGTTATVQDIISGYYYLKTPTDFRVSKVSLYSIDNFGSNSKLFLMGVK